MQTDKHTHRWRRTWREHRLAVIAIAALAWLVVISVLTRTNVRLGQRRSRDVRRVLLEVAERNRLTAADIAALPALFNQRPDILRHVLTNPRDRVTYADLRLIRAECDALMQMAVDAGVLTRPVAYEKYVDGSFARQARPANTRRLGPPRGAGG